MTSIGMSTCTCTSFSVKASAGVRMVTIERELQTHHQVAVFAAGRAYTVRGELWWTGACECSN